MPVRMIAIEQLREHPIGKRGRHVAKLQQPVTKQKGVEAPRMRQGEAAVAGASPAQSAKTGLPTCTGAAVTMTALANRLGRSAPKARKRRGSETPEDSQRARPSAESDTGF